MSLILTPSAPSSAHDRHLATLHRLADRRERADYIAIAKARIGAGAPLFAEVES